MSARVHSRPFDEAGSTQGLKLSDAEWAVPSPHLPSKSYCNDRQFVGANLQSMRAGRPCRSIAVHIQRAASASIADTNDDAHRPSIIHTHLSDAVSGYLSQHLDLPGLLHFAMHRSRSDGPANIYEGLQHQ